MCLCCDPGLRVDGGHEIRVYLFRDEPSYAPYRPSGGDRVGGATMGFQAPGPDAEHIAYHLASVVDDAASGVTRVVRGRDLALHTPLQVALRELLGLPVPAFRHHLLLLEPRGGKLAKLHGAVAAPEVRAHYSAQALCGELAHACGLRASAAPATPRELLREFDWERVRSEDVVMRWTGAELALERIARE